MEELQSWWEVPTIAHFCHVFEATFKLFDFEIEDLELALLQIEEYSFSATIEQLVIRLLKGCYQKKAVTPENWEEFLQKFLSEKVPEVKNEKDHISDIGTPFNQFPVRRKVDILFRLCEMRLDVADVFDLTKDMDSADLIIEPVGIDYKNNIYWYFFGIRLYKESPQKAKEIKIQSKKVEAKSTKTPCRKSSRSSNRRATPKKNIKTEESEEEDKTETINQWSIVCHTLKDWENLIKNMKKNTNNKKLVVTLEEKYLPIVTEVASKKERLEKKRLALLAPRRISSRIEKVQQQRKLEAEEAEQERLKQIEKQRKIQLKEEEERQARERKERARAFEAKRKAVKDRATRAMARELRQYRTERIMLRRAARSRSPISEKDSEDNSSEEDKESADESGVETRLERVRPRRVVRTHSKQYNESESSSCEDEECGSEGHCSDDDLHKSDNKCNSNSESDETGDTNSSNEEQSEDDEESTSAHMNSSEEENRDTNVKLITPRRNSMLQNTIRKGFNIQNFITYTPSYQQPKKPVLIPQGNKPLESLIMSQNRRTYSKIDQSRQIYKNNTPLAQSIKLNFLRKVPQTTKIIQPASF